MGTEILFADLNKRNLMCLCFILCLRLITFQFRGLFVNKLTRTQNITNLQTK